MKTRVIFFFCRKQKLREDAPASKNISIALTESPQEAVFYNEDGCVKVDDLVQNSYGYFFSSMNRSYFSVLVNAHVRRLMTDKPNTDPLKSLAIGRAGRLQHNLRGVDYTVPNIVASIYRARGYSVSKDIDMTQIILVPWHSLC